LNATIGLLNVISIIHYHIIFSYIPREHLRIVYNEMSRIVADMIRDKFVKACVAHYRDDVVRLYDGRLELARRMGFRATYRVM
jgi:hypothetical protein